MTIKDGRTTVDIHDFSKDAVRCFLEASYSGYLKKISKSIFRDVNKFFHVFDVTWLIDSCFEYFVSLLEAVTDDNFDEQLYVFNEAVFIMNELKKRNYLEIVIHKFTSLESCTRHFVANYLRDISSCSPENLDIILDMTSDREHILVEVLVNSLDNSNST